MKRFYKQAAATEANKGWRVELDGRPIKTALGNAQIVPTAGLAETLAREWDKQGEKIDPALFHKRDLADFAIDMVETDREGTKAKLLAFLETDTLCYRGDPDEPIYRRQQEIWEPIICRFEQRAGVTLERISGIMHRPQPEATLATLGDRLDELDPFALTALLTMTSLAASLVIGLSALESDAEVEALWNAANLEEDWQIEQWGEDAEAVAVRAKRKNDFLNARDFLQLASDAT